ncbi:hypothetical protein FE36_11775 [Xanthomonas oryzae pv. oryzicola]|nr:hypothetical protein FE36_11775 [Xanthomonas oryzae pv. oryzicola]
MEITPAQFALSSTITRHLIALPSAVRSNTTSIDHTRLALVGRSNGARLPTGTLFTLAAAGL